MTFSALIPPSIYKKLPPNALGTSQFMGRLGYSLEEAIADIVDNSIDAKSTAITVRFVVDGEKVRHVIIADDGQGMSNEELHAAMAFGVQSGHSKKDLGRYGIGLKAASFSQCQSLTVLSKKDGSTSGRVWTREMMKDEWRVGLLSADHCSKAFLIPFSGIHSPIKHGTIVIWDQLDGLMNISKSLIDGLVADLGLRFQRFIVDDGLSISVEVTKSVEEGAGITYEVEATNPFGYAKSGKAGFPLLFTLNLNTPDGLKSLEAVAHIWPPRQRESRGFHLGKKGQIASRQGFYFYRNQRLIKGGGWHGLKSDGGCKKFCVNGFLAGNCCLAWSNDDRRKETLTQRPD